MASVQRPIKIYARIKPFNGPPMPYEINHSTKDTDHEILTVTTARNSYDDHHFVNNKQETYNFRFSHVFDISAKQKQIFDEVARPVADSALMGYNGTVFAYGQTGTGKTFTMTGSRSVYTERGIIPRTLQYIFKQFAEETDSTKIHSVFISYLEIYNEVGYDLLHTSDLTGNLEDLAKVTILEDSNQQMHLKNLSVHPIESVGEATQLLYVGDHNRSVAETPFNEASTRSHCIFTIHLNIRDTNSSIVRRSKIHLVDLAGSERVSNSSSVTGQLFNEARHINLALHYLEQVIVALGDSGRQHIPYRNSMMTSLLRDSLGGNCMTSMIATLSMEARNIQETLSTNRFAQRVALVTNSAILNEELDPNLVISQLKSEVKKLKERIGTAAVKPLTGEMIPLTEDEHLMCETLVEQFLHDMDKDAILPIIPDMRLIQECFRLLKLKVGQETKTQMGKIYGNTKLSDEKSMAQLVARREAEIKVLMSMLRKEKLKNQSPTKNVSSSTENLSSIRNDENCNSTDFSSNELNGISQDEFLNNELERAAAATAALKSPVQKKSKSNVTIKQQSNTLLSIGSVNSLEDEALLDGLTGMKKEAIGNFMKTYPGTDTLNKVRMTLLQKRSEIRTLEAAIMSQFNNIESLKGIMTTATNPLKIQEALQSQERTCQMQEERLEKANEQVTELETALKTHFRFLLDDFEVWWNKNHKNASTSETTPNNTESSNNDKDLFSWKSIDFLSVGIESQKSQKEMQVQVETKKPLKSKAKASSIPRLSPRNTNKNQSNTEKSFVKSKGINSEKEISDHKVSGPGPGGLTSRSNPVLGLHSCINGPPKEKNVTYTYSTNTARTNNENNKIQFYKPNELMKPRIMPIASERAMKKLAIPTPPIPAGAIRIPRKELFYTPGEIRLPPRVPCPSPEPPKRPSTLRDHENSGDTWDEERSHLF